MANTSTVDGQLDLVFHALSNRTRPAVAPRLREGPATVRAPVERVFAAWTQPARLQEWWGPEPITCPEAEVDLRVGGHYRIANRYADGTIVWISGEFERIEAPHTLVYTWSLAPGPAM